MMRENDEESDDNACMNRYLMRYPSKRSQDSMRKKCMESQRERKIW